jgi:hypothetical protein
LCGVLWTVKGLYGLFSFLAGRGLVLLGSARKCRVGTGALWAVFAARVGPVWIGKHWTVAVRYAMERSGALWAFRVAVGRGPFRCGAVGLGEDGIGGLCSDPSSPGSRNNI